MGKDKLRNKFFRWVGVVPYDDFEWYADEIMNVLEAFERFTHGSSKFSQVVAARLNIKDINDELKNIKSSKKNDKDNDRGMFA